MLQKSKNPTNNRGELISSRRVRTLLITGGELMPQKSKNPTNNRGVHPLLLVGFLLFCSI
jgi:hypothetical protein